MKGRKERNKGAGKAGKFFLDRIDSEKARTPEKWQKYQRKHIKKGKKGRRPYPWRKRKHVGHHSRGWFPVTNWNASLQD